LIRRMFRCRRSSKALRFGEEGSAIVELAIYCRCSPLYCWAPPNLAGSLTHRLRWRTWGPHVPGRRCGKFSDAAHLRPLPPMLQPKALIQRWQDESPGAREQFATSQFHEWRRSGNSGARKVSASMRYSRRLINSRRHAVPITTPLCAVRGPEKPETSIPGNHDGVWIIGIFATTRELAMSTSRSGKSKWSGTIPQRIKINLRGTADERQWQQDGEP
jgi:hypothetical protein